MHITKEVTRHGEDDLDRCRRDSTECDFKISDVEAQASDFPI